MKRSFAILLTFACLVTAPAASAQTIVFDLDALGSFPVNGGKGIRAADDDLEAGYGARANVLYQLGPWLSTGLCVGVISNHTELSPATFFPSNATAPRLGGRLTSIPIHAVVQAQAETDGALGFYGATGVGITDFSLNVDNVPLSGNPSQTDFSFMLGAGLTYEVTDGWNARVGLAYMQAFTGRGEVWLEGNDPQLLLVTLGVQFVRSGDEVGP